MQKCKCAPPELWCERGKKEQAKDIGERGPNWHKRQANAPLALHHRPFAPLLPCQFFPHLGERWYCRLRWDSPPRLTPRHEKKDAPVRLVTSQPSWFGSLPSNTLWCFSLKSCPSIINILPFMFPRLRGRGGKREISPLSNTSWQR